MYNYNDTIISDITDYLSENVLPDYLDSPKCFTFREYVLSRWETILENMEYSDSVTGLLSGSYTMCRDTAKEYVLDNLEIVDEMFDNDFINELHVVSCFLRGEWETMDVAIRCYLLPHIWQYDYDLSTFMFS